MNAQVEAYAGLLVKIWTVYRIVFYSLDGHDAGETVLFRPLTIEDAPEAYRVRMSGRPVETHDFGPVPNMLESDQAVIHVAKRLAGAGYEEELLCREAECSMLNKVRSEARFGRRRLAAA